MVENEMIRETAWSREYRLGPETFRFESKFVSDGIQVSAAVIRENWPRWGLAEQLSFTTAFILKPRMTSEDQKIVGFLMEHGSAPVWTTIAHRLPQHSDREQAVSFLMDRVVAHDANPGSYFRALASIGDSRAIPLLRNRYQEYRASLTPLEEHDFWSEITEYLACCAALWRLEEIPEYANAIRQLFSHPDAAVRGAAQKEYVEKKLNYMVPPGVQPGHGPDAAAQPEEFLRETEWSRIFRGRMRHCWYASKFRTDGLQVSVASIRNRWPHLALEERAEFAHAFCQKPGFSQEDLQILQLLIEDGQEIVLTDVACQLRTHPALETVLPWLLERIRTPGEPVGKYIETLRILGDARAIPPLRQRYEDDRRKLIPFEQRNMEALREYLRCCRALLALTGSAEYQTALEDLLSHPDDLVRRQVRRLLPHRKNS